MENTDKQKMLDAINQNLKQAEFLIDAKLAQMLLRKEHPECEPALVSALEQAREPIRKAFLQKANDAIDTYLQRVEDWKTHYDAVTMEIADLTGEYGKSLISKMDSTFAEIKALEGLELSQTEREVREKEIYDAAEKKHDEFILELTEKRDRLRKKLQGVMLILDQAEDEQAATMSALPDSYVAECEEKSKSIYEEFLT